MKRMPDIDPDHAYLPCEAFQLFPPERAGRKHLGRRAMFRRLLKGTIRSCFVVSDGKKKRRIMGSVIIAAWEARYDNGPPPPPSRLEMARRASGTRRLLRERHGV